MTDKSLKFLRGEIWWVRFDPAIGSEWQNTRPAVVVNEDAIGRTNMRIVVPIVNWKSQYESIPWVIHVRPTQMSGLTKESGADSSQVKALSVKRFERKLGTMGASDLKEVVAGIALCIGFVWDIDDPP